MSEKGWTDQRIEIIIGALLRTGVLLAASVVLIGGVLYLVRHGHETIELHRRFHGEPEALKSIPGVVEGIDSVSRPGHYSVRTAAADRHADRPRGVFRSRLRPRERLHVRRNHVDRARHLLYSLLGSAG